jgi:hypothetical protein
MFSSFIKNGSITHAHLGSNTTAIPEQIISTANVLEMTENSFILNITFIKTFYVQKNNYAHHIPEKVRNNPNEQVQTYLTRQPH